MRDDEAGRGRVLRRAKALPCTDCGRRYPAHVLDFDHVRGEKLGDVSHLAGAGVTVEALLEEIAKCDVVCANCHRRRTYVRLHGRPPPSPELRRRASPARGAQLCLLADKWPHDDRPVT